VIVDGDDETWVVNLIQASIIMAGKRHKFISQAKVVPSGGILGEQATQQGKVRHIRKEVASLN